MNKSGIDYTNPVWTLIDKLSNKAGITEIAINGPDDIYIEKEGNFVQVDVKITQKSIDQFVNDVSVYNNKIIDENSPLFNGSLPDGSRVNIVSHPIRMEGPAITIRKFSKSIQTFDSRKGIFGLSPDWVSFIRAAVKGNLNIIVSGGTGVGKTTFLNLLLQETGKHERKVIIEDTRELSINLPNTIRMESMALNNARPVTVRDLVKNSLRMRPDRIVIGEIRGEEIFDLLQAMNTGHDGSIATIHANSPRECVSRMESLYLLSGYEVPYSVIRNQIGKSIDLVIQLKRNREGMRVVSHITEITDMSGDQVLMQDIGVLGKDLNYVVSTNLIPKKIEILEKNGFNRKLFQSNF
ncbi:MAG: ATPase, T2SS/T4P/T4SS family [Bacteriovorax sp.]|jgi:pilus assembly protein CpaF